MISPEQRNHRNPNPTGRQNVLTPDQVRRIKRMLARGDTQEGIARTMCVSETAIWDIKHGRTWKDIQP